MQSCMKPFHLVTIGLFTLLFEKTWKEKYEGKTTPIIIIMLNLLLKICISTFQEGLANKLFFQENAKTAY